MTTFQSFNLPPALMQSIEKMGFKEPSPVQAATIPVALAGNDILASAQTGTGKTAAFGIPLLTKLINSSKGSALILTPTRELAVQVLDHLEKLMGQAFINTACLIGGDSMQKQFGQLRKRPRLIVGTPGRINDHLERGTLMLHDTGFLVLDETDRMLDMGFGVQLERIAKFLPKQRQTLMFSATLPHNIVKLSQKYLNNPQRVSIGNSNIAAPKINQEVLHTTEQNKYTELLKQLETRKGSIIVFVKTKWGAEKLARRLCDHKHSADAIHGDLKQRRREKVIQSFRDKKHRIMVATDIAARGLDIPHIEHVINFNLPQCPEDYIHRIGRTARAGAEGSAICLISPDESDKWRAIRRLMNPNEKGVNDNNESHRGEDRNPQHRQKRRAGGRNWKFNRSGRR